MTGFRNMITMKTLDNLETHIFIKFVTRDKCKTEARFEPATHTIDRATQERYQHLNESYK